MERPGSTRWVLTSDCAPPAVITPGSVHPGKATGRSCAPAATIRRRASTARARPPSSTSTTLVPRIATALVRGRSTAPDRSASSISLRPRTKSCPSSFALVMRKPTPGCLKIWPPSVGRSSTMATDRPVAEASVPAASPAGPPPITSDVVGGGNAHPGPADPGSASADPGSRHSLKQPLARLAALSVGRREVDTGRRCLTSDRG